MKVVYRSNARKGLRKILIKDAEKILDAFEQCNHDLDVKSLTGQGWISASHRQMARRL